MHYNQPAIIKGNARGYDRITLDDNSLLRRELYLTDEVNPETMAMLIKALLYLDDDNSEQEITLYINSRGGELNSGLGAYDVLKGLRSPLRTVCIGTAYSMAAILLLAGDKREAYEHTSIMIHDPSYSTHDISGKKPHEIQEEVNKLVEKKAILTKIISEVTGKSIQEVETLTCCDKFYDSEEALEANIITKIIRKENSHARKT